MGIDPTSQAGIESGPPFLSVATCKWCGEEFEIFPWHGEPWNEPAEQEAYCTKGCALQAAGYDF